MKWILTAAFLFTGFQGLPPLVGPLIPDSTGTVTGIVRRADTGQPIPEAQVVVVTATEPIDQAMTRASITDFNGKFTIKNLTPGLKIVVAQGEGYFSLSNAIPPPMWASKDVAVNEGQQTDIGAIELVPGATISGRVAGPDGQPVAAAVVQALRASYIRGRLTFTPVKVATTDDLGQYRLFWLPPGDYYVRGQYRPNSYDRSQRYGRVYFPGIPEDDAAPHITVNAGAEVSGIDLPVPIKPDIGFTVSGQVTGAAGLAEVRVTSVRVVPRDRRVVLLDDAADVYQNLAADPSNGQFEVRNVPPGQYFVFPALRDSDGTTRTTSPTVVDIVERNIKDVAAVLEPAIDLRGRVTLEANKTIGHVVRNSILLAALDAHTVSGVPDTFPINPDPETGEFLVPHLPPGKYTVQLTPAFIPYDVYVADVKKGQTSVLDGFMVENDSKDPLEVILKSQGGAVSGVVLDPSRLRPALYATVVLVPAEARRHNFALYRQTVSSSNGRFTFRGLPPGDYKLFAWASVISGAWENPAFLERFEDRGVDVNIATGVERNVQLSAIP